MVSADGTNVNFNSHTLASTLSYYSDASTIVFNGVILL